MKCKCVEFVATDWCTRKLLRLHQIIRSPTSGDLGIPLVLIRPEVPGLKKTRLRCTGPDLFEGRGEKGQCDLRLWMIRVMVVMLIFYSRVVSVILVL